MGGTQNITRNVGRVYIHYPPLRRLCFAKRHDTLIKLSIYIFIARNIGSYATRYGGKRFINNMSQDTTHNSHVHKENNKAIFVNIGAGNKDKGTMNRTKGTKTIKCCQFGNITQC